MRVDPEKARAWQQRSALRYRRKSRPQRDAQAVDKRAREPRSGARKARRNDGPWRHEVMAVRGEVCRSCGTTRWIQCDHVVPRSQGGPSVVENGLPLCRECHEKKTSGTLQIEFAWLDADMVSWLSAFGWVDWDDDGQPFGRGWRHFAPRTVLGRTKEGGDGER